MSRYARLHKELIDARGDAIGRACAAPGCTRLADGWGLVGEASHYGEDSHGRAVRWSTDLNDYAPLCDSHNALLDHGGDWLYCPQGHYRPTFSTSANGRCRACDRERARAYHAAHRDDPAYRERRRRNAKNNRAKRAGTKGRQATNREGQS
jgi:hypothetical protein